MKTPTLSSTVTKLYKGYSITREFPGQWEIEIWDNEPRPIIHYFGSLREAKAWIDVITEGE